MNSRLLIACLALGLFAAGDSEALDSGPRSFPPWFYVFFQVQTLLRIQ